MLPRGGFGWPGGTGAIDLPPCDDPTMPVTCPPVPQPSPSPSPPPTGPAAVAVRIVDALYGDLTGSEVAFVEREARVPFSTIAALSDGSGNILSYVVPPGQTLLISDVTFHAQRPNPLLPGDQLAVDERQLEGYVALHVVVDDRSAIDRYAQIDAPTGAVDQSPLRGSIYSMLGTVIGGADRQPHAFLRAREGQTVRLGYTVVRNPVIAVDHIGASLRGYLVPSAICTAKSAS